jgi:thiamine-phosphate pyrophosphorylase
MTVHRLAIRGLYAVTPDTTDSIWLLSRVREALAGGVRVVQYRSKSPDRMLKRGQARELAALCATRGALFIVNDDVELAQECAAHGVHLGRDDAEIAAARARLGRDAVIGASCYGDLARAGQCADAGADYLAFGSFFDSAVKPGATRASLAVLSEARRRWALPLVAIGGLTPANAAPVLAAGADALAVISALFHVPDTYGAAQAFARLFAARSSSAPQDVIA